MDVHRRNSIEVVGSEGTIYVPSPWQTPARRSILRHRDGRAERIEPETVDPTRASSRRSAAAIEGGPPPRLGRADAVGQARTIEALYRAAEEGRAVSL